MQRKRLIYVIGNAKNVGKTTVLKHIITKESSTCVTSIGLDGERFDSLTGGLKPSITLDMNSMVVTAERFLDAHRFEIIQHVEHNSIVGDIFLAKVLLKSNVIVSGATLKAINALMNVKGFDVVVVDGALDRLIHAGFADDSQLAIVVGEGSPAVGEHEVVSWFKRVLSLLHIPLAPQSARAKLQNSRSLRFLDSSGNVVEIKAKSLLGEDVDLGKLGSGWLYVPGILFSTVAKRFCNIKFCLSNPFALVGSGPISANIYTVRKIHIYGVYTNFFARPDLEKKVHEIARMHGLSCENVLSVKFKEGFQWRASQ